MIAASRRGEAINNRLEHLRGSALGFRNLTNYIARSRLEAGGFRPQPRAMRARGPISGAPERGITAKLRLIGWPVWSRAMLVTDLRHFVDLPVNAPGRARRVAEHLGDVVRGGQRRAKPASRG